MTIDRTTKLLLALLVIGIWGLLLRPVFEPVTARAAESQTINVRLSADPIQLNVNHTSTNGTPVSLRIDPLRVEMSK